MEHQIFFMEYQEATRFFGPGANVRICKGFCTDLRNHSGSIFGPKNGHMLQKTHSQIDAQKMKKSHANQAKAGRKCRQMAPKREPAVTQCVPKRYQIDT